jgi:hypothetical protein
MSAAATGPAGADPGPPAGADRGPPAGAAPSRGARLPASRQVRARLPLAITMGDPCGIGPEIIAKTFADPSFDDHAVVVGDPGPLEREIARLALPLRVAVLDSLDPNDPLADLAVDASTVGEDASTIDADAIGTGPIDAGAGGAFAARIVPLLVPDGHDGLPSDLPVGRVAPGRRGARRARGRARRAAGDARRGGRGGHGAAAQGGAGGRRRAPPRAHRDAGPSWPGCRAPRSR